MYLYKRNQSELSSSGRSLLATACASFYLTLAYMPFVVVFYYCPRFIYTVSLCVVCVRVPAFAGVCGYVFTPIYVKNGKFNPLRPSDCQWPRNYIFFTYSSCSNNMPEQPLYNKVCLNKYVLQVHVYKCTWHRFILLIKKILVYESQFIKWVHTIFKQYSPETPRISPLFAWAAWGQ